MEIADTSLAIGGIEESNHCQKAGNHYMEHVAKKEEKIIKRNGLKYEL